MKRRLLTAANGVLGLGLLILWLESHGSEVGQLSQAHLGLLICGLLCFPLAIWLQLHRTALVIDVPEPRRLLGPVLLSGGMNVLLPSMLGDLYEIGALSQATGQPVRAVLVRLLHRLSTTLSALGVLLSIALASVSPSWAFVVLIGSLVFPFVIDQASPHLSRWARIPYTTEITALSPLGPGGTSKHIMLAILQHSISALGVFLLGAAINNAISPVVAAGMLAIADLVTYLPVPLGGIGLHHWGVSGIAALMGTVPSGLVALNHGIIVAVGGLSAATGFALAQNSRHNT